MPTTNLLAEPYQTNFFSHYQKGFLYYEIPLKGFSENPLIVFLNVRILIDYVE